MFLRRAPTVFRRMLSSETPSKLVSLSVNDKTGIAKVTMNNIPVNALSTPLMKELLVTLEEVKKNNCRGMIITSSAGTVFSAGLDLNEVYQADMKEMRAYWWLIQELCLQLYKAPFITAAAINGHAPAGGCVISLTTDYRVMANNPEKPYRIGLNETPIGLMVPLWIQNLLTDTIGRRQASLALLAGALFSTEDAFELGLIDDTAADGPETVRKCEEYLLQFQKFPQSALVATKLMNRRKFIEEFQKGREFDIIEFTTVALAPEAQGVIGKYLEATFIFSCKYKL